MFIKPILEMYCNHFISIQDITGLLYFFYIKEPFLHVVAYNINCIKMVDFKLSTKLTGLTKPAIDSNCIYIGTAYGEVLILDKFSGEIINKKDIGRSIVCSDILVNNDSIFFVSKTPIRKNEITNPYIQLNNINTNDYLLIKSNLFSASNISFSMINDNVLLILDKKLHVFGFDCQQQKKYDIIVQPDHKIEISTNYLFFISAKGIVQCFDHNYNHVRAFPITNSIKTTLLNNDILYVFGDDGSYLIDIIKQSIVKMSIPPMPYISSCYMDNKIFLGTENGILVVYDIVKKSFVSHKISALPISNIKLLNSKIIAVSNDQIREVTL